MTALKAYTVNDCDDRSSVFFADNEADAQQQAADEFSIEIEELGDCWRSEDLDQYAETGLPDALTMVQKHGWWHDCYGCSTTVQNYDEDAVMSEGHLYCSAECVAEEAIKQAQKEALMSQIKAELLTKWPGLTVEWFNLAEHGVFFRWPGGTAGAYWKRGNETVQLQPQYADEWRDYKAQIANH